MGATILRWIGWEALKALAWKLFMTQVIPKIFDWLISGMRKLANSTSTKVDDTFVDIQVEAKQRYLEVIEDEFG